LSLTGVTIGIFCIVSVFTVLDSLEKNIKRSLDTFGSDIIIVDKWPWTVEPGEEYAWWEYTNRPVPTMREYTEINKRITQVKAACFIAAIGSGIEYLNNQADNIQVWGSTKEFGEIRSYNISEGRFFNDHELTAGRNICVIGNTIAEELFRDVSPVGREVKIKGMKAQVIGVFSKEGSSVIGGGSVDEVVILPIGFLSKMVDITSESSNPQIWVKGKEGVSLNELKDMLVITMRSLRNLNPKAKDNFALNQTSLISTGIDQIFNVVNIAGWFIGIFAVLVGGFGIANIMFVSVKERTSIIGIQKAIGAKGFYIIMEVLYESVMLSLTGGLAGLILIYLGTFFARARDFEVYLDAGNIIFGLFISALLGIGAGLIPAYNAARLDPVKAISSTF